MRGEMFSAEATFRIVSEVLGNGAVSVVSTPYVSKNMKRGQKKKI